MNFRVSTKAHINTMLEVEAPKWLGEDAVSDLLPILIDLFLTDSPPMLDQMAEAIVEADGAKLYEAAHFLKGSGRSLGLVTFACLCEELERMGEKADFISAAEELTQLAAEYAQVAAVFRDYLQRV